MCLLIDWHLAPPQQGWVTLEVVKYYSPQGVVLNICPTRMILSPALPCISMMNYFLSAPQMSHPNLDPVPSSWPLTIVANKNARNSHVSVDWLTSSTTPTRMNHLDLAKCYSQSVTHKISTPTLPLIHLKLASFLKLISHPFTSSTSIFWRNGSVRIQSHVSMGSSSCASTPYLKVSRWTWN